MLRRLELLNVRLLRFARLHGVNVVRHALPLLIPAASLNMRIQRREQIVQAHAAPRRRPTAIIATITTTILLFVVFCRQPFYSFVITQRNRNL